jgi:hypothetical protein
MFQLRESILRRFCLFLSTLLLSGCAGLFNHGFDHEAFIISNPQHQSQAMLACMKPVSSKIPHEFIGILDKANNLNPLTVLLNENNLKQIPLLCPFNEITDFADSFFEVMPELYRFLHDTETSSTDRHIYKDYFKAYFDREGFVSRSGLKLKFPGLSNNIDKSAASIDFTQVGSDIVRVVLEAIRDGAGEKTERLPGIDGSTGVKLGYLEKESDATQWNMKPDRAQSIESTAAQAEGFVATALGKAARGGFWTSLNNEALAKVAETVAGIQARHAVERFEWCKNKTYKR